MLGATIRLGRSGGTGRRAGLKIPCPSGRVGSTPTSGMEHKPVTVPNPGRPGYGRFAAEERTGQQGQQAFPCVDRTSGVEHFEV